MFSVKQKARYRLQWTGRVVFEVIKTRSTPYADVTLPHRCQQSDRLWQQA